MTRWVSLSSDANPRYSAYLPIACLLWKRLGWEPLVLMHDSGWDTSLGMEVEAWLDEFDIVRALVSDYPPLSVANTMRFCRLAGPCLRVVADGDLVMMSDADMMPISRSFFDVPETWDVYSLRSDMHGFLQTPRLPPVNFRFTMCYVGARACVWRDVLGSVVGDISASLRQLEEFREPQLARVLAHGGAVHRLDRDAVDCDEGIMSSHLLSSDWLQGDLMREGDWCGLPLYRQGNMRLVAVRREDGLPEGMLILGGWRGDRLPDHVIDWHASMPPLGWFGDTLATFWPNEVNWISDYWSRVRKILRLP